MWGEGEGVCRSHTHKHSNRRGTHSRQPLQQITHTLEANHFSHVLSFHFVDLLCNKSVTHEQENTTHPLSRQQRDRQTDRQTERQRERHIEPLPLPGLGASIESRLHALPDKQHLASIQEVRMTLVQGLHLHWHLYKGNPHSPLPHRGWCVTYIHTYVCIQVDDCKLRHSTVESRSS